MRRTAAVTALILTAVSILLLVAAARCTHANAVHLPSAGVPRCHRHLPLSHLSLWQLVTTALLPIGFVLMLRWWRVWPHRREPAATQDAAIISLPPKPPARIPTYLARDLAQGLAGGHVVFGERHVRRSLSFFTPTPYV